MASQKPPRRNNKYVFVVATDNPCKEHPQNRRLAHSHVGRYIWQRNQGAEAQVHPKDTRRSQRVSSVEGVSGGSSDKIIGSGAITSDLGVPSKGASPENCIAKLGLRNLLGEGLWDPFQCNPSYSTHQVHDAMNYAVTTMWPGLFLEKDPAAKWVPAAMADPVLFSACVHGASMHMQQRQVARSQQHQRVAMQISTETIRRVHSILSDQTQATGDGVAFAVLTLAHNWQHHRRPFNPDPHPRRPLQDLQWLALYSSFTINDVHCNGLIMLLRLKGMSERNSLPGFAPLLSYLCMLRVSKDLCALRPQYIPLPETGNNSEEVVYPQSESSDCPFLAAMPPQVRLITRRMHQYNEMLARYLAGSIDSPDMVQFANRRNRIQHQLLSLPPYEELECGSSVHGVVSSHEYEAARTALLLYSLIVIFPIPFIYGPYGQLREALRVILVHPAAQHLPKPFVLWAVSLAAIPPVPTGRQWFLDMLPRVAMKMGISSWDGYRVALASVMWQESVLDPLLERILPDDIVNDYVSLC